MIDLFELEFKNIDNNIFNYKLNILNIIYMINNESNKKVDLEFRLEPNGNREITRRDIIIFLILFKLRYVLIKKSIHNEYEKICFETLHKKFASNDKDDYEVGSIQILDKETEKIIFCQETKIKNEKIDCFIIEN